jgi:hypothetical protein
MSNNWRELMSDDDEKLTNHVIILDYDIKNDRINFDKNDFFINAGPNCLSHRIKTRKEMQDMYDYWDSRLVDENNITLADALEALEESISFYDDNSDYYTALDAVSSYLHNLTDQEWEKRDK